MFKMSIDQNDTEQSLETERIFGSYRFKYFRRFGVERKTMNSNNLEVRTRVFVLQIQRFHVERTMETLAVFHPDNNDKPV